MPQFSDEYVRGLETQLAEALAELNRCRLTLDSAQCHQVGINNGILALIAQNKHDADADTICRHLLSEELDEALAANKKSKAAIEGLLDVIEDPPERNCSCHLNPPCNDCVEYSGIREALEFAREAIK